MEEMILLHTLRYIPLTSIYTQAWDWALLEGVTSRMSKQWSGVTKLHSTK
jgi:hypothetical protein